MSKDRRMGFGLEESRVEEDTSLTSQEGDGEQTRRRWDGENRETG